MDPKDTKNAPPDPVQQARDRLAALVSEQQQILNTATAAGRDLLDEENAKLKDIEAKQRKLEDDIARRIAAAEAQARLDAPQPRVVEPMPTTATAMSAAGPTTSTAPPAYHPIYGRDVAATSPTQGFETALAWYKAVKMASINPALTDRRLTSAQAAATTFANESAGPEGGWAQPTEFSKEIVEIVAGAASLLGRMRPVQSSSNVYQIPVDPTTQWGTTGVQAAKQSEGGAATVSNLALQARVVTLYKATSLVNVTEELATDNPATITYINRVMARQLLGIVERWLLQGSGAGEPLGILKAPALVSVAKDGSQTAATITKGNLSKMVGRLIPGSEADAFYVCSPSAKIGMVDILLGAGGNTGTDLQRGFGAMGLGYPVVTSMEAPAIGTAGDCTLVAPSGFLTLTRGGVNTQITPYFYFDQGLNTLRAYIRIGQTPLLAAAIAPKLDTNTTLSHCVTTEARS